MGHPAPAADGPLAGALELRAERSQLAAARRYTERVAGELGLDRARVPALVCAVNEAVTNAIRHGRPDQSGHVRIGVSVEDGLLTVEVTDAGRFTTPPPARPADAESGRGFEVMRRCADHVALRVGPLGTTVALSMELA